jgi:DNA repair exonuclease SbcCD ATPase subunit/DNA repair exonuclease SbcCD nuclease subunit
MADIHIRGHQYLDEIEYTFDELVKSLTEKRPDLIVIPGDIYHSKLTVTNEYFDICSRFFKRLLEVSPVVVTLGNHDLALNNKNRLDALSPVVNALSDTKNPIYFEKNSKHFRIGKIVFHVFSILDHKSKWSSQDTIIDGNASGEFQEDDIHIALYHGAINGCKLDNGWTSRGNIDDIDIFKGFDFAMLGDIHKQQFLTDRVAYPGSLRQNNFGEDGNKGYLIWDIDSKDSFSCDFVILPQKRKFYTIDVDSPDALAKDESIPQDSRIRVRVKDRIGIVDEIKIKEKVKEWYKPHNDVTVLSLFDDSSLQSVKLGKDIYTNDNIRSLDAQRKLIENYFKDKNLDKETLEKVCELDKKYNSYVDASTNRNSIWNLEKIKWSNLFSYGQDNEIDLTKLNGLIGIFGSNGNGKSSIIDALSYGLFNSINKEGAIKNGDYVNSKKKKCEVDLSINFDGEEYKIRRETTKAQGLGNVKNEIDFYKKSNGKKTSLNGETKPDTNQHIRDIFGSSEDFVATSLCPQEGLTKFLDVRGTDKKKIFNKFFDLDFFETKFRNAEEDFSVIKAKLKDRDGKNYESILVSINEKLDLNKKQIDIFSLEKQSLENELDSLNNEIINISLSLNNDVFNGDINSINKEINVILEKISETNRKIQEQKLDSSALDLIAKKSEYVSRLTDAEKQLKNLREELKEYKQKTKTSSLLETVPCGDKYPTCQFIKNAHEDKNYLLGVDNKCFEVIDSLEQTVKDVGSTIKLIDQYEQILNDSTNLSLTLENLQLRLATIEEQKRLYNKFEDSIITNKKVKEKVSELKTKKEELLLAIGAKTESVFSTNKSVGSLENEKEDIEKKIDDLHDLKNKNLYYELYLNAMGKNGISYQIMSQKLPIVNEEANRILNHVVDYSISIEDNEEEKSIKIYMTSEKGKRPVELASGSEKTMISLALRTALWRVTSIPKSPILILDESFGFMEEDKQESIVKMLQYLKNYFKHIFIITHDSNLKNVVDFTIYIERNEEGFSFCKV